MVIATITTERDSAHPACGDPEKMAILGREYARQEDVYFKARASVTAKANSVLLFGTGILTFVAGRGAFSRHLPHNFAEVTMATGVCWLGFVLFAIMVYRLVIILKATPATVGPNPDKLYNSSVKKTTAELERELVACTKQRIEELRSGNERLTKAYSQSLLFGAMWLVSVLVMLILEEYHV